MLRRLVPGPRDLILLAALWLALALDIGAEDIWWLLATGQTIAETGHVPTENLFSFTTPHYPWICHEWGFALGAWWMVSHWGAASLLALRATLFATTVALVHHAASRRGQVLVALWLAGAVFLLLFPQSTLRPWLVSNLLFALLLFLLWHGPNRTHRVVLPVLFLLWANIHGSWLLGLGALTLGALFQPRLRLAAVISAGATLVNPYGPRLHLLVVDYFRGHAFQDFIVEWGPPEPSDPLAWFFAFHLLLGCWFIWHNRRRLPRDGVILALLLAAMSLRSFRNSALWAIATAMLLATMPIPLPAW